MSLFVLAVGAGAATSLIVSALQGNSYNRDHLIALNLAVEGVEAVRNIRDTNWLRFSADKLNCWNMLPDKGVDVTDCLVNPNLIAAGNYTVDLEPTTYKWFLTSRVVDLDLSDGAGANDALYRLDYFDLDSNDGSTTSKDIYLTQGTSTSATDMTLVGGSPFYRMVKVVYETGTPDIAEKMLVYSTVEWQTSTGPRKVELVSKLTNFQQVVP